jgi:hypothetical protein
MVSLKGVALVASPSSIRHKSGKVGGCYYPRHPHKVTKNNSKQKNVHFFSLFLFSSPIWIKQKENERKKAPPGERNGSLALLSLD